MERLTYRDKKGKAHIFCKQMCADAENCTDSYSVDLCQRFSAFRKLAEYEDLEEQGRLLRLPVKKGDIVWELCKCDDGVFRIFQMEVKVVIPYGELRYASRSYSMWNIYAESDYTKMYKSFYDIGTSLFLTQEEAEAKLAEMEESHEF